MNSPAPMFVHELEFEVRDYECDLQGIVNNAVYLHYLEHARHSFLLGLGIDFAALHLRGIDLVVSRVEADYKASLTSRDRFTARLGVSAEGSLRIVFAQELRRIPDGALSISARVTGVCLDHGRPVRPGTIPELASLKL